ncbi:hypothetical protein GCM10027020_31420 [Nocardioides salsibiostraticola]
MRLGAKISTRKAGKLLAQVAQVLLPGERVTFVCQCSSARPSCRFLLVTSHRVIGWSGEPAIEFRYVDPVTVRVDHEEVILAAASISHRFGSVVAGDRVLLAEAVAAAQQALGTHHGAEVQAAFDAAAPTPEQASAAQLERARTGLWPDTLIVGGGLSRTASRAVLRLCRPAEEPWLILIGGNQAGLMIAWEDRIALLRSEQWADLAAQPFDPGADPAADPNPLAETYRLWELAKIQYDPGLLVGTLIFRTTTGDARRHPSMSLTAIEHRMVLPYLIELGRRIAKAKKPVDTSPPPRLDVAAELRSLESLRDAGLISAKEYARAKARLGG